ncbi:MAG TPA: patatin-like phospholipase family protein, partial [Bacteroidia bacterium]
MERRIIFLLLLCICARFVYAQKVGVVLSGGGAWGLAHIGVLKELEKNNIPIDFIAGTSMGALIGGLYASGYSPEELELIVTHPEFSSLVTGRQTSEQIYYFKVPEPTASIINIKLNLDSGQLRTSIPTALVSAYNY